MNPNKSLAISYIENQTWSTTRLGLDRTRELLGKLGNPQNDLRFIHVAGSNGKGSTSAMLYSIFRAAGYKTGLYTSPYLWDFSEQLQINGVRISEDELEKYLEIIRPVADAMEDHPSRFEILTALGMLFFKEQGCDIVILEVGMGGALDSTNVISPPLVSVITNIGIEHSEYLGNTIEEIAATKAGIIKENSAVVCYDMEKEAVNIIKKKAREVGADFLCSDFSRIKIESMGIDKSIFTYGRYDLPQIELSLVGKYQVRNASVVLDVVAQVRKHYGNLFELTDGAILEGLKSVKWPARFSVLSKEPLFILDGGHNPQCVNALCESLEEILPGKKFMVLMGVLEDKDYGAMLGRLLPFASFVCCVTPDSPRALAAGKLKEKIATLSDVPVKVFDSIEEGLCFAQGSGEDVLALGSLYMAGSITHFFPINAKKAQRKSALERKAALGENIRKEKNQKIVEKLVELVQVQEAAVVASYLAFEDEVDLDEFHRWAIEKGKRLCFPVCRADGIMEFYEPKSLEDVEIGKYGIRAPKVAASRSVKPKEIDVIIVPCVAYDKEGNRLGHGKGYYDRYLAGRKELYSVLVAYDEQEEPEIFTEDTDIRINKIITE